MKRRQLLKLAAVTGLGACGGSTGGGLVTLEFSIGGVERPAPGPLAFTTALGWEVTLEAAKIALGPFYFNIGAPNGESFRGPLVIIQATSQIVVDVLDPQPRELRGGADGETGHAVVAEIGLLPPDTRAAAEDRALLGTNFGWVVGRATRAGFDVPFAGPLAIEKSLATPQTPLAALQRVRSAAADLVFATRPQRLVLRVDPQFWFEDADFADLATGPAGPTGRFTWVTRSGFATTLLQGVKREEGVYRFALENL